MVSGIYWQSSIISEIFHFNEVLLIKQNNPSGLEQNSYMNKKVGYSLIVSFPKSELRVACMEFYLLQAK